MKSHTQPVDQQHDYRKAIGRFFPIVVKTVLLTLVGLATTAHAQTQYFLGRPTATEYIFDTPLPADFAAMVTATGQKYGGFTRFVKISNESINGQNELFMLNEVAWDGDKVDRGTIAYASSTGVETGSWVQMDPASPEWSAVASQLKAQATARGNWRYTKVRILAASGANQPPLRSPIPETIQIQAKLAELGKQTKAGMFYPSVQIPSNLDEVQKQMLAYGNVGRKDPDFRKNNGAKTATDLSGPTVQTKGGTEKVFKQNPTPPYFTDSTLNDKLNLAAQFQAEYQASINVMGHGGPRAFTDPRTGKSGNMSDLGDRVVFFEGPGSIVEAAGGGTPGDCPRCWMSGDTHFRPWFSVDGIYPLLGYGAAKSANGNWYFVAVAVRHPDGVVPAGSNPMAAAPTPTAPAAPAALAQPVVSPPATERIRGGAEPVRTRGDAYEAPPAPAVTRGTAYEAPPAPVVTRSTPVEPPSALSERVVAPPPPEPTRGSAEAPAGAASYQGGGLLSAGEAMLRGSTYTMEGHYLKFQDDGNLCVYRTAGDQWVWCVNNDPSVRYGEAASVTMMADGRLVMADASGGIIWQAPQANAQPNSKVVVFSDGAFQILSPGNDVLWSSR